MEFFSKLKRRLFGPSSSTATSSVSARSTQDHEALIKQGREQFKKLVERGTDLPVVLL